jgi:hypothetical protein
VLLAGKEASVSVQPTFELLALPALREMIAKERECGFQVGPSEEPGEIVTTLVVIGPIHTPSESIRQEAEGKGISGMQLYL